MRTFIAVPLSLEVQRSLDRMQQPLRGLGTDVRWTSVDAIHLTLKFLGEIDPPILPTLGEALRCALAPQASFSLGLNGLGGFPNLHVPKVIWCGLNGEIDRLEIVEKEVERVCTEIGFSSEQRPFRPHLTLGRVRSRRNLRRLLHHIETGYDSESHFEVHQVNIYKSTLMPHGARYEVLETIPLLG